MERDSKKHGTAGEDVDLALLVDGLEAEREQGITIDVAYRYFTTPKRAFIVADAGPRAVHPQHGDRRLHRRSGDHPGGRPQGVLVQTKRHSYICSMLGIRSVVLAVNKMDLVDFSGERFYAIVSEYRASRIAGVRDHPPDPLVRRYGDNVTVRSDRSPWYDGPTLMEHLESADVLPRPDIGAAPLPRAVGEPAEPRFRGFAGTVASGTVAGGDDVAVAASGAGSEVARIVTFDGDRDRALPGESVTLTLDREIDIARGDVLAHPMRAPSAWTSLPRTSCG